MQRITIEEALKYFPFRKQDSHKGSFGKILNVAGSANYVGASVLSSVSALKVGAGYVTLACPMSIENAVHSLVCDVPTFVLKDTNGVIDKNNTNSVVDYLKKQDVLSIGCGLSLNDEIVDFVNGVLCFYSGLSVIDADALNALSKVVDYKIPKNSIVTPHVVEMSRLMGVSVDEINNDREKYAIKLAKDKEIIVVLKGHNTIVTNGVFVYVNESGNSALAKAGSGDVLTGIISGILAQNKNPYYAAVLGVYIHGLAGEFASQTLTEYSVLASNLIDYIPFAIKNLLEKL